jgi:hypothetical protein
MLRKHVVACIILVLLAAGVFAQQRPTMDESFWRLSHEQRHQLMEQRAKRSYEPDGKGRRANIPRYIEKFKEMNIYDPKSSYFVATAKTHALSKSVVLEGEALFDEYRSGLERTLSMLGFKVTANRISVLPDARLGTDGYALVTTYTVGLYREPRRRSEMLDQALYGTPVRLLKPSDDEQFFLAQLPDGYIGWMNKRFLERMDLETWHKWRASFPRALLTKNLVTRHPATNRILEIPRGATLPITQPPRGTAAHGNLFVLLPDGAMIDLSPQICDIVQINPERSKERILQLAKPLMGTKYVWGGLTDRGLDCSGFTNRLYHMIGINLPRDADEQSAVGEIVGFRGYLDGLLPGDLLFFLGGSGRVSHVAMSLGGLDFIHSSHPEVKLGSFDTQSRYYDARIEERFAFARRILPAGF